MPFPPHGRQINSSTDSRVAPPEQGYNRSTTFHGLAPLVRQGIAASRAPAAWRCQKLLRALRSWRKAEIAGWAWRWDGVGHPLPHIGLVGGVTGLLRLPVLGVVALLGCDLSPVEQLCRPALTPPGVSFVHAYAMWSRFCCRGLASMLAGALYRHRLGEP